MAAASQTPLPYAADIVHTTSQVTATPVRGIVLRATAWGFMKLSNFIRPRIAVGFLCLFCYCAKHTCAVPPAAHHRIAPDRCWVREDVVTDTAAIVQSEHSSIDVRVLYLDRFRGGRTVAVIGAVASAADAIQTCNGSGGWI
jgi:hypothetical protein